TKCLPFRKHNSNLDRNGCRWKFRYCNTNCNSNRQC
ncbi:hypothetical protein FUMI01_29680, partial [Flavobacterium sp. UMI-01]